MPRKIELGSIDLNDFGAIGVSFNQVVEDGDLRVIQTNMRRAIAPDQDLTASLDDLDVYFESIGYPKITLEDRDTLKDVRVAAENNPGIKARAVEWQAKQEAERAAMAAAAEEPPPNA